jgi:putative ABC transport system permease protein
VTPEYVNFASYDAERGRLMSPIEVSRARPITVLGWQTAERLFDGIDPIGKDVQIEGVHFQVAGVSARKGSAFGRSQDEFAVIPLGRYESLYGARQSLTLMVKPPDPSELEASMEEARMALRASRGTTPRDPDDFGMFTSDTFLDLYRQATSDIFAVLVGVVALSLVVGGIVIMNIMLMVVTERTREIGLRKAVGARRRDILWQFLIEAVALSLLGGAIGLAAGYGLGALVVSLLPIDLPPAYVPLWAILLAFGFSAAVGIFFGIYPAGKASRLDPIEALRYE